MNLTKKSLPDKFGIQTNDINVHTKSLPFYVKECGYSNERKFTVGNKNEYSDILLLYCVSGIVRFDKHKTSHFLHPDSLVVSACSSPLTFIRASKEWSFLYVIVSGSHAKQFYNNIRNNSSVHTANPLSCLLDQFIDLYNLHYSGDLLPNMEASLLIHHIFCELYKLSLSIMDTKSLSPVQESVVNTALKYIGQNYMNFLDIDTICNEVSFSKYYFCKLFKKQVGVSVHQYVSEFRITKAKELLTYSKLSIGAIATTVGYKNTLAFSRAFERSTHMTPTEFRRYY
ncbi:MAG TPA: AraC family transcriptional regulator [Lachnospiraceae bacterium]|nr:AraC family transcriptional regulator [Lachnospiraceae bacterium]